MLFGSAGERDDKGRSYHAAFHFHPMRSSVVSLAWMEQDPEWRRGVAAWPARSGGGLRARRRLRPSSGEVGTKRRAGKGYTSSGDMAEEVVAALNRASLAANFLPPTELQVQD